MSTILQSPQLFLSQYMNGYQKQISNSLSKLSSGLRVRSPADSVNAYFLAASLESKSKESTVVAEGLEETKTGLKNALNALTEIKSIMGKMKDISYRAMNSNAADSSLRENLAVEYNQLKGQIDEIVDNFNSNSKNYIKDTDAVYDGKISFTITIDEYNGTPDNERTFELFTTNFDTTEGLNLGEEAAPGSRTYTDATDNTYGFGSTGALSDADEITNAGLFYAALDGSNSLGEGSGLVQIERNIDRVSNELDYLEGRQNFLNNKANTYEAARNALVGVDAAAETTRLTSSQIMKQAGAFFLAQANSSDGNVIQLLYGFNN